MVASPLDEAAPELGVLVVDDTTFYRKLLRRCVEQLPGVHVVGTASNGRVALGKMEYLKPDFVILDIEMPELGGMETLEQIHQRWPQVGVVVVSGHARSAAESTVKALALGALDFVPKPNGPKPEENLQQLRDGLGAALSAFRVSSLRTKGRVDAARSDPRLAAIEMDRPQPRTGSNAAVLSVGRTALSPRAMQAIGIAASTGGPQVLSTVIPALPEDLPVPVFVVQHMPAMFTAALARSLDRAGPISVCEAENGQIVEPGTVYIAPGGHHMVVRKAVSATGLGELSIGLNTGPAVNGCRPAADVLFRSMAVAYQSRALAIVMSGMGCDGRAGVSAMKSRGAICLTQSEQSCVVSSMPNAVVTAGLSDESLPPEAIAARIRQLTRRSS